jgi:hypothetical protein
MRSRAGSGRNEPSLEGGPQAVREPGHARLLPDAPGGDAVHAGGVSALAARNPGERHEQRRRVGHEVEQVIKPAARSSRRPAVKPGLHPRYPLPRPQRVKSLGAAIRRRVLRHCRLPPFSQPLPPSPMCRAFPGPQYYGGSVPPARPSGGRRAYPGQRPGCPPPGAAPGGSRVHCGSLSGSGARLCPGSIAMGTPQAFPIASRHGFAIPPGRSRRPCGQRRALRPAPIRQV